MYLRIKNAILLPMKTHCGSQYKKLNMYETSVFAIRIQGELDEDWSDYFNAQSMTVEADEDGSPVTILISEPVDQAALIGIINRLNDTALPLVSIECLPTPVENDRAGQDDLNQPYYQIKGENNE
jgi:hypothetical protein